MEYGRPCMLPRIKLSFVKSARKCPQSRFSYESTHTYSHRGRGSEIYVQHEVHLLNISSRQQDTPSSSFYFVVLANA